MGKYIFSKRKDSILVYILLIIPLSFIYAFIHEMGHGLAALALGYEIETFFTPLFHDFSFASAWIRIGITINDPLSHRIQISLAGSIFNLIIGTILLLIAYYRDLPIIYETILGLYGFILSFDFIFYNILDIFIIQKGDWWFVFEHYPIINLFFLIFSLFLIWFYYTRAEKIFTHIKIIDYLD